MLQGREMKHISIGLFIEKIHVVRILALNWQNPPVLLLCEHKVITLAIYKIEEVVATKTTWLKENQNILLWNL